MYAIRSYTIKYMNVKLFSLSGSCILVTAYTISQCAAQSAGIGVKMKNETVLDLYEEEDTQKGKFLTFTLGVEAYGLEISYVTEIVGIQPITEVPELPDYRNNFV